MRELYQQNYSFNLFRELASRKKFHSFTLKEAQGEMASVIQRGTPAIFIHLGGAEEERNSCCLTPII